MLGNRSSRYVFRYRPTRSRSHNFGEYFCAAIKPRYLQTTGFCFIKLTSVTRTLRRLLAVRNNILILDTITLKFLILKILSKGAGEHCLKCANFVSSSFLTSLYASFFLGKRNLCSCYIARQVLEVFQKKIGILNENIWVILSFNRGVNEIFGLRSSEMLRSVCCSLSYWSFEIDYQSHLQGKM
jgi:hypothetical protein